MTLNAAQTVTAAGLTASPYTATTSDTISGADIIPGGGVVLRIITTGTTANVSVLDPNLTSQGNPGTVTAVTTAATGTKYLYVPPAAVNPATNTATVTFSTTTGVTYDLIKF